LLNKQPLLKKQPKAIKPSKETQQLMDGKIKGELIAKIYKLITLFPTYYKDFIPSGNSDFIKTLYKKTVIDLLTMESLFENIRKESIALTQLKSIFNFSSKAVETIASLRGHDCQGLTDDITGMSEYDEIIKDLALKYADKLQTRPEIRLILLYSSTLMMKVKINGMLKNTSSKNKPPDMSQAEPIKEINMDLVDDGFAHYDDI
jgi:hypothetical protein